MAHIFEHLLKAGQTLGQGLLHLVFPRVCWVCQEMQPVGAPGICRACATQMTSDTRPTCFRCSSTVGPHVDTSEGCVSCRDSKLGFDQAFRLGPYDGLLREVVLRMKIAIGEGLAEAMGPFWADHLAARLEPLAADLVLPVPLHWTRHYHRGFNQSEVLAQSLADRLGIPCPSGWLRRWRRTAPQKNLQGDQRLQNVKKAFCARRGAEVAGKTILLVDDVLTTGATASEAARPLKALDAKRIILVVLAHDR